MLGWLSVLPLLASGVIAQQTSFHPGTGVRSLWIPFKSVAGTPVASIAQNDAAASVTVYVISCPTGSPQCLLAPNLTVTEGPSTVQYTSVSIFGTSTVGTAILGCQLDGTTSATCSNDARGGGMISKRTTTIGASAIAYQAVDVTMTLNNTSTEPVTVTVAPSTSSTSSSTSSSTAGATGTGTPWKMGGAVGAGLLALAAL